MSLPLPMHGKLFRYGRQNTHFAFQSGAHKRHVILIGGLMDGLLSLSYAPPLFAAIEAVGWSLVQPYLSSSNQGYGTGSLDRDAEEICMLLKHLKTHEACEGAVIIGHSTGCQDAIRFIDRYGTSKDIPSIRGVILQGPVSDQELAETYPDTAERLKMAKEMIQLDKGEDIVFRDFSQGAGEPITARRYAALTERRGDDDMFSSYLTDDELKDLLGHMSAVETMIVVSGNDEFVPDHVDKEILTVRLAKAMEGAKYKIVDGVVHDFRGHEERFVSIVLESLGAL